jgi:hypothetical protein
MHQEPFDEGAHLVLRVPSLTSSGRLHQRRHWQKCPACGAGHFDRSQKVILRLGQAGEANPVKDGDLRTAILSRGARLRASALARSGIAGAVRDLCLCNAAPRPLATWPLGL